MNVEGQSSDWKENKVWYKFAFIDSFLQTNFLHDAKPTNRRGSDVYEDTFDDIQHRVLGKNNIALLIIN